MKTAAFPAIWDSQSLGYPDEPGRNVSPPVHVPCGDLGIGQRDDVARLDQPFEEARSPQIGDNCHVFRLVDEIGVVSFGSLAPRS